MSTEQELKKATERFYLGKFQELDGRRFVIIKEREKPDFLLEMPDGEVIGLEVRMLFKDEGQGGSPNKKQEQGRRQYLENLANEYYGQGGLPAHVNAIFTRRCELTDSWIKKLAKRLRMARPSTVWAEKRFKIDLGKNGIATFFVRALPDEGGDYRRWICVDNSVGWVRNATDEILTEVMIAKATKLPEYCKAAKRTILLIVAERTQESGMFEYTPNTTLLPSQGFSEVHLLVHPLKTYKIA